MHHYPDQIPPRDLRQATLGRVAVVQIGINLVPPRYRAAYEVAVDQPRVAWVVAVVSAPHAAGRAHSRHPVIPVGLESLHLNHGVLSRRRRDRQSIDAVDGRGHYGY